MLTFLRERIMIYEQDDENLLRIFNHTSFIGLKRFIINLLQLRQSKILQQNLEIFTSDPNLKVQALRAVGYHDQVANLTKDVQLNDIPFVIDSRNKTSFDNSQFITPIRDIYNQQGKPLWIGNLLKQIYSKINRDFPEDMSNNLIEQDLKTKKQPSIFGITKLRLLTNSSTALFNHLFEYCDQVIAAIPEDQLPIALEKFKKENLHFIKQPHSYIDSEIYKRLFGEGRKRGATHYIHIDDDERITNTLEPEELRAMCASIMPGEAIAMPWVQIFGEKADQQLNFEELQRFSNIRNLAPYKDLVYCDDGIFEQQNVPFHGSWIPVNHPTKRYFSSHSLLHFEGTDLLSLKNKFNRYIFWDYSINQNLNIIYERYLPILLRMIILNGSSANSFLIPHKHGNYAHVPRELQSYRYIDGVEQIADLLPIQNHIHKNLLLDIIIR